MPCYVRVLTVNGDLLPAAYQAESLSDAARYEPDEGVYTVANTFNTFDTLLLDAHLDRMEDSARRAEISLRINRPALKAALRRMIEETGYGDVRFRITVSRDHPDRYILSLEPFKPPPPEVYAEGVRCVTLSNSARTNAAAKTTGWMHQRQQVKAPNGIYETLLLNAEGDILEGATSNFYAVLNGELRTAGTGVLPGIAQRIVYDVAPRILPLRKDPVNIRDLPLLDEAFITSSSRGIVPVVEIDGQKIGAGQPGEKTRALRDAYLAWAQAHLEPL